MSIMSILSGQPALEPEDHGDTKPSDDGGSPGEALSRFDFSQIDPATHADPGSEGSDHSDLHAALASMSAGDALEYAIGHIGDLDHLHAGHLDADHVDVTHFATPADTSHGT